MINKHEEKIMAHKTVLTTLAYAACATLASLSAVSISRAAEYQDYARVVSVSPQIEQVSVPEQRCHTEYRQVTVPQERSVGGSIIGGIAGGLLGNQVGRGNGRTAATAVGAVTGAIVGDRIQNNDRAEVTERPVQRCSTVERVESRTTGYNVTYQYHGHTYTSVMPYDPGERLRVRITVAPAD